MKFCTSDEPERSAEFHVASNPAVGSSPSLIKAHVIVRDNADDLVVDSGLINSRVKPAGGFEKTGLDPIV